MKHMDIAFAEYGIKEIVGEQDKTLIAIISAAIGAITQALLQERQQVINFFFGSSLGSKNKSKQMYNN